MTFKQESITHAVYIYKKFIRVYMIKRAVFRLQSHCLKGYLRFLFILIYHTGIRRMLLKPSKALSWKINMLRIGLIGCGYIARKHVQTIARFNDLSLEAVCYIDPHKMEEIVKLYHLQKGDNLPISFYQNYQNI